MTFEFFKAQINRLIGLKFAPADLTTHWEALQHMPEAAFEAAVTRAGGTRVDFPTPVELKQDADQAAPMMPEPEADRGRDLSAPIEYSIPHVERTLKISREWNYYCSSCSDSGWQNWFCGGPGDVHKPWVERRTCDRRGEHTAHEWVEACACASWNPELKRRKASEGKYAAKAGKA